MARVYITNGVVYVSKQAGVPATPAADELGIFLDSSEILSFILDTGVTRNVPAWVPGIAFTPALSFGGGTTGITYLAQVGRYTRMGGMVFFSAFVALTAKGSSTGAALITGLPVAALNVASYNQAVSVRYDSMSSISGAAMAFLLPNVTTVRLEHLGTGTAAQLTDANFGNSSSVLVTGSYES